MCRSMVDIQSPTAEIRRGKKEEEKEKRIETTAVKYNDPPITKGGQIKRRNGTSTDSSGCITYTCINFTS